MKADPLRNFRKKEFYLHILLTFLIGFFGTDCVAEIKRTTIIRDAQGNTTKEEKPYPLPEKTERDLYDKKEKESPLPPSSKNETTAPDENVGSSRKGPHLFYFTKSEVDTKSLEETLISDVSTNTLVLKNHLNEKLGTFENISPFEMTEALNDLLERADLNHQIDTDSLQLNPETAALLKKTRDAQLTKTPVSENDYMCLNRQLIQRSFPNATRKSLVVFVDESAQSVHPTESPMAGSAFGMDWSGIVLWNELETHFRSPDFSNLSWEKNSTLKNDGKSIFYEHPFEDTDMTFLLRGGLFEGYQERNSQTENGFFVLEKIKLTGGWVEGGVGGRPLDFLRLNLSFAGFYYHASSTIETNATVFTYEGFSGDSLVTTLGLGVGLETPWEFPVRLYAETAFYLPINPFNFEYEEGLENGFGRLSGGLLYRF